MRASDILQADNFNEYLQDQLEKHSFFKRLENLATLLETRKRWTKSRQATMK